VTVTDVRKDTNSLTMAITSEFDATADRVWQLWNDPRQLERWWGPPTYPATFVDHDLSVGSVVTYYMTGPEGDKARGWWRIIDVDAPKRIELEDGFADESGNEDSSLPTTHMTVDIEEVEEARSRMTIVTKFSTLDDMEKLIEMGMEQGMMAALGQIEDILAE
jgi:uncharacterized protein YndB with AHSA1/START domain